MFWTCQSSIDKIAKLSFSVAASHNFDATSKTNIEIDEDGHPVLPRKPKNHEVLLEDKVMFIGKIIK